MRRAHVVREGCRRHKRPRQEIDHVGIAERGKPTVGSNLKRPLVLTGVCKVLDILPLDPSHPTHALVWPAEDCVVWLVESVQRLNEPVVLSPDQIKGSSQSSVRHTLDEPQLNGAIAAVVLGKLQHGTFWDDHVEMFITHKNVVDDTGFRSHLKADIYSFPAPLGESAEQPPEDDEQDEEEDDGEADLFYSLDAVAAAVQLSHMLKNQEDFTNMIKFALAFCGVDMDASSVRCPHRTLLDRWRKNGYDADVVAAKRI